MRAHGVYIGQKNVTRIASFSLVGENMRPW